jgi:ppGpp synthetase/RelA/SpoT-type nucleotidyltranferase
MKIVQSIQSLYLSKYGYYNVLSQKIEQLLNVKKKRTWHFLHRLKSSESFALKLETGRFTEETIFDDFFACTLVVENLDEIINARKLIESLFEVVYKRPQSDNFTFKNTDSFPFDDLRLYCRLGSNNQSQISKEVFELIFEFQIKTFLQHAWSIATHDIIYKTDQISWGKERVAYQVKAALEQAEVAISGAKNLSTVKELAKENKLVKKINRVIILISKHFRTEDLPEDKRRLAQNVISLVETLEVSIPELEKIIINETKAGKGPFLKNLSPFQIIVNSIYNQDPGRILKFLRKRKDSSYKILISPEMSIPNLKNIQKRNLIKL